MLEVNSYVMYGGNGVCLVADRRKEKFAGQWKEYYILKPVNNEDSTLYVPTDNEKLLSKMKDVLSYDEIMDIIHSLPKENIDWVEDNKEREAMYDEIFSSGDRRELLLLVKSLYKHKQERKAEGKKLWTIDENAMKRAEKLVYEEFATVLNIEAEEVVPFIEEELERYYAEKAE
ncbi:MAG: CarD family transcriptional regulator [Acutalibacteraceae bacterium]|nr:CarD family transcriptional regulator [Acutalibacteraceae bacterium]